MSNKTNTINTEEILYCTFDMKGERRQVTSNESLSGAVRNKETFQKNGYDSYIVKIHMETNSEEQKIVTVFIKSFEAPDLLKKISGDDFMGWVKKAFQATEVKTCKTPQLGESKDAS